MRTTIPVPGRLGAVFLSSSITVLLLGVMVYSRGGVLRPMLAIVPVPALGGILCFSYLIWFILWMVLYYILGGREAVGTLPVWTAIFLGATLLGVLIVALSLEWGSLLH